ncbi:MTH1187 family thiamine-binding protein [Marinifilum caeruleilacunae]|uniref:MTH1187 family thiamine-binding protein n=1 Tax=Marinifilum caeruleilacunae TaxID=2499076 RepID=A0ABX1WZ00_9BACT|nr:MTH1187 family thiamine-binding protein [Marinifilum caeruleilacunae]NOU61247.1 MTH1187 family thiamine-binding protein [Marinifilum caeruleilacunae]
MSVLVEFSIFPTDKGDSVSSEVSKVIDLIRESGYNYQLTAMGTLIETDSMSEALEVVNRSHDILAENSNRIYCTMNIDSQKGKDKRLKTKVESIEEKIGKVSR